MQPILPTMIDNDLVGHKKGCFSMLPARNPLTLPLKPYPMISWDNLPLKQGLC
jgi:hypothetical protein